MRTLYGPLFSVKQAANYLNIGRTRIYQMLKNNELEHIKDRNGNLIAKSVLDDYIEERYKKEKAASGN